MLALWSKKYVAYLLWPFSLLYRAAVYLRHTLYRLNLKKINKFSVPIIVIGNITVGGTGKTPLVIAVVKFLQEKGWRPGVISRGYAGKVSTYPQFVHTHSNPREVGDEPVLIVSHTGCATVVDPNRSRGVRMLLAKKNCNIIVSDDGLQHLALGRHIEIAVIDGQQRFGNGFCLPAGPLRENTSRLKKVDFIVTKGQPATQEFSLSLIPEYFYQVIHPDNIQNFDYFKNKTLHAVAGIGNPEQFFQSLRTLNLLITEHPFPDHHFFTLNDLNFGNDALLVITEKDAVKCRGLSDARLWCLKTTTHVDQAFFTGLHDRIIQINNNLKSSSHSF